MDLRALVLLTFLPLALAGCSDGSDGEHPHDEVAIEGNKFDPVTLTVDAGAGVIWTNHDAAAHSAVADDGAWQTGILSQHEDDEVHFDEKGTFAYHCGIHPTMKGTIRVE